MKNVKDIVAKKTVEYYSEFVSTKRDDILHTQEVVSYTRLIAAGEGMSEEEIAMQETAAWLHDIGCPCSRERYGNSLPVNQQNVGREVTNELLKDVDLLTDEQRLWLADVVGTHHQYSKSLELGFSPLFEADLIVNLLSGYMSIDNAAQYYKTLMNTATGKSLFKTVVTDCVE
ncbi:MAG: hypothetical protein R3Y26_11500 [Rikenellaceae bacterium]